MPGYRYVKKSSVVVTVPILPVVSFVTGFFLLSWVLWPIASFELAYAQDNNVISPVSEKQTIADLDLTHASNWFPDRSSAVKVNTIDTYTLSIPKLRISSALVRVGTDDLSKNLIHYGDSGYPGKPGTAVIFGHSVLPAFYNPKDYLTIFSLLPTLKENDDIFIRFDGVDYRYKVITKRVTDPKDVSGLEQRYDGSYITLVTCVPPGTYYKRLWLTAKLTTFDK